MQRIEEIFLTKKWFSFIWAFRSYFTCDNKLFLVWREEQSAKFQSDRLQTKINLIFRFSVFRDTPVSFLRWAKSQPCRCFFALADFAFIIISINIDLTSTLFVNQFQILNYYSLKMTRNRCTFGVTSCIIQC